MSRRALEDNWYRDFVMDFNKLELRHQALLYGLFKQMLAGKDPQLAIIIGGATP